MEKFSTSRIMRDMQIQSTEKYHLTSIRMAMSKKSTNNKYWSGFGEMLILCAVGGM